VTTIYRPEGERANVAVGFNAAEEHGSFREETTNRRNENMDRTALLDRVRGLASETLEVEPATITENANFADDLEADSLDLVELVMAMEEEFDVAIPEEELEGIETVGQALDLVQFKLDA